MSTIFQKIIDKQIPADIVFEDERCLAFRDITPKAPTHILVIPKQPIRSLAEVDASNSDLVGHLFFVVRQIADQLGLSNGYRTVINCGVDGGQTVDHLHIHLLAGRSLGWPPG